MKTIVPKHWQNLFQHKAKEKKAPWAEEYIMGLEQGREFEWLSIFHEGLDGEDDDEVWDEGRQHGLVRWKRSDTFDIGVKVDWETEGYPVQ